jgi:hypothetical protein
LSTPCLIFKLIQNCNKTPTHMKISTSSFCAMLVCFFSSAPLFAQGNQPYIIDQTGTFNFAFAPGDTVILMDEEVSGALPIGFPFEFFDSTYTSFYISSNGFVTFTSTSNTGCCDGQMIPDVNQPNNLIAIAWADLDPSSGGTIMYKTEGTAPNRKLTVTFLNVPHYNSMFTAVTAQLVLYEGTHYIEIHTAATQGTSSDHTMGLENQNGTIGIAVPGRNASNWSIFSDFVQFRPVQRAADDAGVSNVVLPGFCAGAQTVSAVVKNFGSSQINQVTVNWEVDGLGQTPVSYSTTIDTAGGLGPDSATVSLGALTLVQGQSYTVRAWTSSPNMTADGNLFNDTATISFSSGLPPGTYTIGGTNPDYATWQAAIADLNNFGICGPVVFDVRNGTYNESLELLEVSGASASNTITFQAESGDSTDVVLTHASAGLINQTLLLNGASHVILQHLTIRNTGANFQASVIAMEGGASFNTIRNNVLEGPAVSFAGTQSSCIFSSQGGSLSDNSNHNVIQQNSMRNGAYGIYLQGSSLLQGEREVGNQIIDNVIVDAYDGGIFASSQDSLHISGNEVEITAGSSFAEGIVASFCYEELVINENQLRLNDGKGFRFFGLNGSPGSPLQVYNNFISLTGSDATDGIELNSVNFLHLSFNNVNLTSGGAMSAALKIDGFSTDCEIKNNIFAHAGGGFAIVDNNSSPSVLDYNNYFVSSPPLAMGSTSYPNLPAWQAATGQDSNSIQVDPLFTSATDLHVNKALLNAGGITIPGITTDIDGETRGTPPDIGADEFTPPPSFDASMANLLYPQAPFAAGSYPVRAVIRNSGTNALNALTVNWYVDDTLQATIPWGGSLTAGQSDTVNLGMLSLVDGRVYELEARVDLPQGLTNADPTDDTLTVAGLQTALLGIYTIGGNNPDFVNFNAAVAGLTGGGVLGAVTFLVRDGVYEEQVLIPEFAGSSCQNPVVFRSQSADSSQ